MKIQQIEIPHFKVLEDINISFDCTENAQKIYPIISINGGGKSTFLQYIFTLLHCSLDEEKYIYLNSLLSQIELTGRQRIYSLLKVTFDNGHSFEFKLNTQSNLKTYSLSSENLKNLRVKINSLINNFYAQYNASDPIKELKANLLMVSPFLDALENGRINWDGFEVDYLYFCEYIGGIEFTLLSRVLYSVFEETLNQFQDERDMPYRTILRTKSFNRGLLSKFKELELYTLLSMLKKEQELIARNVEYEEHVKSKNKNVPIVIPIKNLGALFIELNNHNYSIQLLQKLASSIYLSGPSTQIFQFLPKENKSTVFNKGNDKNIDYQKSLVDAEKKLPGLFTFNFVAIDQIIKLFNDAKDASYEHYIKHNAWGNEVKRTFDELNNLLSDKEIKPLNNNEGVRFIDKKTRRELKPEDLSHGELKRLSYYVWLKNIKGGLVLIDEIDLGLHPTWQETIVDDLVKWNPRCQYILGTHSPQIICNVSYKNLIILKKKNNGKSTVVSLNEPPLEGDVNTVLKTIMGSEFVSLKLSSLREKYKQFYKEGKEGDKDAQKIKREILEFESEGSSFFKKLQFIRKFKKSAE